MKRVTYIILLFIAGFLTFSSCDREGALVDTEKKPIENLAEGQVNLKTIKVAVESASGASTRATVNTADFYVRIFNRDNEGKLVKEWKYSEMPEIFTLKVGNYSVAAYSHDELPAAFDRPFYYGAQDFTIVANDVTDLGVLKCFLRSIMVTVEYDDELKALLGNDVVSKVSVENGGSLSYAKDETRAGYFQAINQTSNVLKAKLNGTVEGATINYEEGFSGIKAGEHRKIRYTLKSVDEGGNGSGGSAGMTIVIDATCEVVDIDVDVDPGTEGGVEDFPQEPGDPDNPDNPDNPGNPDDDNKDLPTIVGANLAGAPFDIDKVQTVSSAVSLVVNITAPKGIGFLKVMITSDNPDFNGIGADLGEFDLAHSETMLPDTKEMLTTLGFPMDAAVLNKTELPFDIGGFTGMLISFKGTHTFRIVVTDNAGKSLTKLLKMKVE